MTDLNREDRTARAIRERRERAGRIPDPSPAGGPTQNEYLPVPTPGRDAARQHAEIRREIEALKDRPVERARRLAEYVADGVSQNALAAALGVGQPWVSKRLALTRAPVEVLQQIEAGTITENYYYSHRAEIEMRLAGGGPPVSRPVPLTITLEAGRALAEILAVLAAQLHSAPIRIDERPTRKHIREILNLRAEEIRSLVVAP